MIAILKTLSLKFLNDFCPTSLLLIFAKLFGKFLELKLSHFKQNTTLTLFQFGFRKNCELFQIGFRNFSELVTMSSYDKLPKT